MAPSATSSTAFSLAPFPSTGSGDLLSAVPVVSHQLGRVFGKRAAVATVTQPTSTSSTTAAVSASLHHSSRLPAPVVYIPSSSSPAPTLIQRDPINDLLIGLDRVTSRANSASYASRCGSAGAQPTNPSNKRPADTASASPATPSTTASSTSPANAAAAGRASGSALSTTAVGTSTKRTKR